jgi:hypothetical protein
MPISVLIASGAIHPHRDGDAGGDLPVPAGADADEFDVLGGGGSAPSAR